MRTASVHGAESEKPSALSIPRKQRKPQTKGSLESQATLTDVQGSLRKRRTCGLAECKEGAQTLQVAAKLTFQYVCGTREVAVHPEDARVQKARDS